MSTIICPRCQGTPTGIGCLRCDSLGTVTPGEDIYAEHPLGGVTR